MEDRTFALVDRATGGDQQALEELLLSVQDMVFNLALRMLGSPQDAEDAAQEINIRIVTGIASFRKESAFSTWAYRIAANHLLNYKKSMFAKLPPLSFEYYGADIEAGCLDQKVETPVDQDMLAQELKMSCTNVMLQCLDAESRLIYVLGIMFKADSGMAGDILGTTPEAYRQRLSRIRKKVEGFLRQYCGLATPGKCDCKRRVGYAIAQHRLNPDSLEYTQLAQADGDTMAEYIEAMEEMNTQSAVFAQLPRYRSPQSVKAFLQTILQSDKMEAIRKAQG